MTRHATAIEWTHRPGTTGASWNPIRARDPATGRVGHHCEHITEACRFCYAERWQPRLGTGAHRYARQERDALEHFLDERTLLAPLRWKAPRTIFPCSMTDLFGEWVPNAWLDRIFAVAALTPQHTYIVLTKRPARMKAYIDAKRRQAPEWVHIPSEGGSVLLPWEGGWPTFIEFGVSVCDQADADAFVPLLLATPAASRFVSYEPALGPVDFTRVDHERDRGWEKPLDALRSYTLAQAQEDWGDDCEQTRDRPGLDWIIAGGESGPQARPSHPDWFRAVRDQCASAGVPFFFKQRGEWSWVDDCDYDGDRIPELPADWRENHGDRHRCMRPDGTFVSGYGGGREEFVHRIGKRAAGRLLDGVEHNGFPLPFRERVALGFGRGSGEGS